MKLIELSTVNFMPYAGKMTLSFPTDSERNVMFVFADNMRGKTSLLNALRWAFYGRALGRHSREILLNDLVNKEAAMAGDWTMEACVTFEADGHRYELRRRATKRSLVSRPTRPEDFEVSRALQKDGSVIGDHLIDAEINRFVPEQTSRFFLFDGELLQEYESLLIDGSEQGEQIKMAIEQALGVPTLIRGREDAQTLLKSAQRQQSKDIEKVAGLEKQAERQRSLQTQIDSLERDIEDLNLRLKSTKVDRADLDDFIERTETIYKAKEALVAKKDAQRRNTERQDELTANRLGLVRDAWRDIQRQKLTFRRDRLQEDSGRLADAAIERGRIAGKIEQLKQSIVTEVCNACGQPLHQGQREKAVSEVATLEDKIAGLAVDETQRQSLAVDVRDLNRLLRPGSISEIEAADRELARLSVELTQIDNEIEKLDDQVKGQDTAEITSKRTRRDSVFREEVRLEHDIKSSKMNRDKAQKDLEMLSIALERFPAARSARSSQLVRVASALDRIFTRSIDQLRDDLKSRVELLASSAFKSLTTQDKYSGLRINNNYGLSIIDENGDEVTVRSAGAEQIVALSLIDGLSRAGRTAGPVVMDTPFGRLDLQHRANILKYLPTTTNQLILLVHEGEINKSADMADIGKRIGCLYEIKEVNPRHSRIERVTQ